MFQNKKKVYFKPGIMCAIDFFKVSLLPRAVYCVVTSLWKMSAATTDAHHADLADQSSTEH